MALPLLVPLLLCECAVARRGRAPAPRSVVVEFQTPQPGDVVNAMTMGALGLIIEPTLMPPDGFVFKAIPAGPDLWLVVRVAYAATPHRTTLVAFGGTYAIPSRGVHGAAVAPGRGPRRRAWARLVALADSLRAQPLAPSRRLSQAEVPPGIDSTLEAHRAAMQWCAGTTDETALMFRTRMRQVASEMAPEYVAFRHALGLSHVPAEQVTMLGDHTACRRLSQGVDRALFRRPHERSVFVARMGQWYAVFLWWDEVVFVDAALRTAVPVQWLALPPAPAPALPGSDRPAAPVQDHRPSQ